MTYREKLNTEHPELINPKDSAGCDGCPSDIPEWNVKPCTERHTCMSCKDCWSQEVPEKKHDKLMLALFIIDSIIVMLAIILDQTPGMICGLVGAVASIIAYERGE